MQPTNGKLYKARDIHCLFQSKFNVRGGKLAYCTVNDQCWHAYHFWDIADIKAASTALSYNLIMLVGAVAHCWLLRALVKRK